MLVKTSRDNHVGSVFSVGLAVEAVGSIGSVGVKGLSPAHSQRLCAEDFPCM